MPARRRWQGTTTQRGYDGKHKALREQRLTAYRPGDPCAHGGEPLPYWPLSVALLAVLTFVVGAVICFVAHGIALLSLLAIAFIGLAFLAAHHLMGDWRPWARPG